MHESGEEVCLALSRFLDTKQKHADLGFCYRKFLFDSPFLSSLRHGALLSVRRKMTARKHRKNHYVEQAERVVLFFTREATFG